MILNETYHLSNNVEIPKLGLGTWFISNKDAAEAKSYIDAKKAISDILNKTGLDYLDLIIIHAPQPWRKWRNKSQRYFKENIEVWRALEEAYKSGKVQAIGVSNFLEDDLQNILVFFLLIQ